MNPTCQRCGAELVEFGDPDSNGYVLMICPASPNCVEVANVRKWLGPTEEPT